MNRREAELSRLLEQADYLETRAYEAGDEDLAERHRAIRREIERLLGCEIDRLLASLAEIDIDSLLADLIDGVNTG